MFVYLYFNDTIGFLIYMVMLSMNTRYCSLTLETYSLN